ncbi:hypothetical protein C8F01DRAFT_1230428 [Mycena amicta]|nr:hypothetical protein C8F01DRAFT_1230428 [Mycena amicta]
MLRSLLLVLCELYGVVFALSPPPTVAESAHEAKLREEAATPVILSRRAPQMDHSTLIAIIVGVVGGVAMLATLFLLIRLCVRRQSERNRRRSAEDFQYQYGQASVASPNTPAGTFKITQAPSNEFYEPSSSDNLASLPRNKSTRRVTADQSLWFPEKSGPAEPEARPVTQNYSLPRRTDSTVSSIIPAPVSRTLERKSSMQQLLEASGIYEDQPPLPTARPSPSSSPSPISPELSAALASRAARLRAASPPRAATRTIARQKSEPDLRPSPRPVLHLEAQSSSQVNMLIPRPRESSLSPEQHSSRVAITPVRRQTRHYISASEDPGAALGRPQSRFSISPVARSFPSMTMNMLGLRGQGEETITTSTGGRRHNPKSGSDSR